MLDYSPEAIKEFLYGMHLAAEEEFVLHPGDFGLGILFCLCQLTDLTHEETDKVLDNVEAAYESLIASADA